MSACWNRSTPRYVCLLSKRSGTMISNDKALRPTASQILCLICDSSIMSYVTLPCCSFRCCSLSCCSSYAALFHVALFYAALYHVALPMLLLFQVMKLLCDQYLEGKLALPELQHTLSCGFEVWKQASFNLLPVRSFFHSLSKPQMIWSDV